VALIGQRTFADAVTDSSTMASPGRSSWRTTGRPRQRAERRAHAWAGARLNSRRVEASISSRRFRRDRSRSACRPAPC